MLVPRNSSPSTHQRPILRILKILCLSVVLANSITLSAKNSIDTINQQLRTLFGSIPHPSDVNFCYDMACHLIDSAYYDTNCQLETNANTCFS